MSHLGQREAPTRLQGLEWETWCQVGKALAIIDPSRTKDLEPGGGAESLPGIQREH